MAGVLVNQSSSISHTDRQPQASNFFHSFSQSSFCSFQCFSALMSWMIRPAARAKGASSTAQSLMLKLCMGMFNITILTDFKVFTVGGSEDHYVCHAGIDSIYT